MLYDNLVPVIIALPLLSAIISVCIRNYTLSLVLTIATIVATFSLVLFMFLYNGFNDITYHFGDFAPPFGIEYKINSLSFFYLIMIMIIAVVTITWSKNIVIKEIGKDKGYLFNSLFLLCLTGFLGIVVTNDLFNLFVFLEISSLSTYILISMGNKKASILSAFNALIVGTVSASFYIFGVGILYMLFGTLNADDMVNYIYDTPVSPILIIGIVFIVVGACMKMALTPVFSWLPQVYQNSPVAFTPFLAGISINIGIYIFIKVLLTVIGRGINIDLSVTFQLLMILGLCSAICGGIIAIKQDNLGLLLGFSSVAQIGFIMIGFSFFNLHGFSAALLSIFAHAIVKCGLFLCAGNIAYIFGTNNLSNLRGVGKDIPFTFFAIIFFAFSLAGLPGSMLFYGKLYLIIAAINYKNVFVFVLMLSSTILSFAYSWKIISKLWLGFDKIEDNSNKMVRKKIPLHMNIAVGSLICVSLILTIFPSFLLYFIEQIINFNIAVNG